MKIKIFIDKDCEEEIIIYAKRKTELVSSIEKLVNKNDFCLTGFSKNEAILLSPEDVFCFVTENGKVYAITKNEKLLVKQRLYHLEENLSADFVKINQSSLANIKAIERFDTSVTGTLKVKFKNGYTDYVSRRNLKNIKERFGI